MPAKKKSPELFRTICEELCLKPFSGLERIAKEHGVSAPSIYLWQGESVQHGKEQRTESDYLFEWIGIKSWLHRHLAFCRAVAIARIDAKIIEDAVTSRFEPMLNPQTGIPFWKVDARLAADAKRYDDDTFEMVHGRPRTDIYERNEVGELIPMLKEIPAAPAVLIKAASSLLSSTYGERVAHSVQVGGVLRIGVAPAAKSVEAPVDASFTLLEDKGEEAQPTNTLAVAERPKDVAEFKAMFGGKRLVECVFLIDADGHLLPPVEGIVIVEGSSAHKRYSEAGIECKTVEPKTLLEQGYCNNFLLNLAQHKESALVADLRRRLREGVKHHVPEGGRTNKSGPDGRAFNSVGEEPVPARPPDLRRHPRAYDADTLTKPVPKPGYSGQGRSLDQASIGAGPDPATGFGNRGFPMTRGTYR
jgi:hypothetical protein